MFIVSVKWNTKSVHFWNSVFSLYENKVFQLMSAGASLERFGERHLVFIKWRLCKNCFNNEWTLKWIVSQYTHRCSGCWLKHVLVFTVICNTLTKFCHKKTQVSSYVIHTLRERLGLPQTFNTTSHLCLCPAFHNKICSVVHWPSGQLVARIENNFQTFLASCVDSI